MRTAIVGAVVLAAAFLAQSSTKADANPTATPAPPPAVQADSGPVPGSRNEFIRIVGDRVFSDFDRFDIRRKGRATLQRQAEWLEKYPKAIVRIEGYCDERGTREYNLALGARRANDVREYLMRRGIDGSRITTISYGKERPVCVESTKSCWAKYCSAVTVVVSGTACKDCGVAGRTERVHAGAGPSQEPRRLFGLQAQRN